MNTFPPEALDSEDTPQFFKTIKEELKCYIKQFQSDQNNKRINVSFLIGMVVESNAKFPNTISSIKISGQNNFIPQICGKGQSFSV